jgi:O-antigen/teichoic acid export membrane protein
LVWSLPIFFAEGLGAHLAEARWVVGLLGASVAIQMTFDAFRGVMTGCHRWDLYNALNSGAYSIHVFGMIAALLLGGGLRSLSAIYLAVVAGTEVARMTLAFRICPELRIRRKYADWSQLKEMIVFGGKTVVASLPPLVTVQTTSVLVAGALGPAALAVLARPVALIRHVETFIQKFSFVLTPTAGAIQGAGREAELRQFVIDTTRYGVAFTLPLVLFLGIFGGQILRLWMGPSYEAGGILLAILAAGYLLPASQSTTLRILMGLNLHGRVALWNLLVTVGVYGIGVAILSVTGWTLAGASALIAASLTAGNGIVGPYYACQRLGIPVRDYARGVFLIPGTCGAIFAGWLVACRWISPEHGVGGLVMGALGGAFLLGGLYWYWLLSDAVRSKLLGKLKSTVGVRKWGRESSSS